jgi:hypothetical protein
MAQVALVIAKVNGNKDVDFSTFLPDWSGTRSSDDLVGKLLSFRDEHRKAND